MAGEDAPGAITCLPVTPARFADLEALFGPNGAVQGCWCMYWRRPGKDWDDGVENHRLLAARVGEQPPPGVLAYRDGAAVGWAQIGRREEFGRLAASRHLAAVDAEPVWCINCFFIHRRARRQGVATALLGAAIELATAHGASMIEAYPVDREAAAGADLYTGTPGLFSRFGFVEVARRHPSRPIMRLAVGR